MFQIIEKLEGMGEQFRKVFLPSISIIDDRRKQAHKSTCDQSRGHTAHHLRRVDEDSQEDAGDEDSQKNVEQGAVETHGG